MAQLIRVRTLALLHECDEFLSVHGPIGGKPASACDATWLIRHRGKLVGVACSNWSKFKHYHLATAAVHESWRGHGGQRMLIAARLKHASSMGREARTYTHESNIPSMVNLIKCGMYPAGRWDQWVHFTSRFDEA